MKIIVLVFLFCLIDSCGATDGSFWRNIWMDVKMLAGMSNKSETEPKISRPLVRFTRAAVLIKKPHEDPARNFTTVSKNYESDATNPTSLLFINATLENTSLITEQVEHSTIPTRKMNVQLVNEESNGSNATKIIVDMLTLNESTSEPSKNYSLHLDFLRNETELWNFLSNETFANETAFNISLVAANLPGQHQGALSSPYFLPFSISLISLAFICLILLIALMVYRRRSSHGVWTINETSYGKKQPILAAFENECFTMDSRLLGSYVIAENENPRSSGHQHGRFPSSSRFTGDSGPKNRQPGHQTNKRSSKSDTEMLEMVEKKSFEHGNPWRQ